MASDDTKGAYVREVTERTRNYLRELQQENERLRALLAVSEAERARIGGEVSELRQKLEAQARGQLGLDAEQLQRLESENRRYAERYVVLEQKNTQLANLYVASYRLHETLAQKEVLSIIQEIVINLIGCEQHGIFELAADGRSMRLLASMGVDTARCEVVKLGDDALSRSIHGGDIWVAPDEPVVIPTHPHPVTACVPLRLAGKATGAVVLYRLLPQKPGVEAVDRELFELLSVHAGMALYTTKLHQALGEG
jgi:hypothetical protein